MASVLRQLPGSIATFADNTDMDSLAAGAGAYLDETGFDNSQEAALWPYAIFELLVDFAVAPIAGRVLNLYLLPKLDGTNYPDAHITAVQSLPAVEFVVASTTDTQRLCSGPVALPPCEFRGYLVNDADQALSTATMHVKIKPYTTQITAS